MSSTSELVGFAARLRGYIESFEAATTFATPRFDQFALELFALQFEHNVPYRRLCEARGIQPATVNHWTQIPAAPTSAFKEFQLSCLPPGDRTTVFHSSGTTVRRPSRHYHNATSLALYEASLLAWFDAQLQLAIGNWQLAILTPPPAQAPHSSLVHMFETIRRHHLSCGAFPYVGTVAADGTWTLQREAAVELLRMASTSRRPLLIFGTAFSFVHLLDHLADQRLRFELPPGSCALETGGYKGRSRSLPKTTLHTLISQRLSIHRSHILCEYGMSELSSQAYDLRIGQPVAESPEPANSDVSFPLTPALSLGERGNRSPSTGRPAPREFEETRAERLPLPKGEGWGEGEQRAHLSGAPPAFAGVPDNPERPLRFPPWARVQIISPESGDEVQEGETGLIRVFDLANVYSVMAVQTEDLGVRDGDDGFVLAGRALSAEPRGCSLLAV